MFSITLVCATMECFIAVLGEDACHVRFFFFYPVVLVLKLLFYNSDNSDSDI